MSLMLHTVPPQAEKLRRKLEKEVGEFHVMAVAPGSCFLSGEYGVFLGYPAICQPIPLYEVVLARRRDDMRGFHLADRGFWITDPRRPDTVEQRLPDRPTKQTWERVCQYLASSLSPDQGVEVAVASGIPSSCGLGSSGALAVCLVLAVEWLRGEEARTEINAVLSMLADSSRCLPDIAAGNSFSALFRRALMIENLYHECASGANPFSSLVGSPTGLPIVFNRSESQIEKGFAEQDENKPMSFWGNDLADMSETVNRTNFQLRLSAYYSSMDKITKTSVENVWRWGDSLRQDVGPRLKELRTRFPNSLAACPEHAVDDPSRYYFDTLGYLSFQLLDAMRNVIWHGTRHLDDVITIVNRMRYAHLSGPSELVPGDLEDLLRAVPKDSSTAAKVAGAGGGGDVLVLHREGSRRMIMPNRRAGGGGPRKWVKHFDVGWRNGLQGGVIPAIVTSLGRGTQPAAASVAVGNEDVGPYIKEAFSAPRWRGEDHEFAIIQVKADLRRAIFVIAEDLRKKKAIHDKPRVLEGECADDSVELEFSKETWNAFLAFVERS